MAITLIRLDSQTIVNIDHIVQVTIENLTQQRRKRNQTHQSVEQRARMEDKYWKVYVYIRSDTDYNAQAYTQDFRTEKQAQEWVDIKFSGSIVNGI